MVRTDVIISLAIMFMLFEGSISGTLKLNSHKRIPDSGERALVEPAITAAGPVFLDPTFGRYSLSWEVDWVQEIVTFTAIVRRNGFVGFGISKAGSMTGADIVVAEFNNTDGSIIFQDYHGVGHTKPLVDAEQNWTLEESQRNGTHTILVFSRHFDTQDSNDVVITDEDTNFIFAVSLTESPELVFHGSGAAGFFGTYPVNILSQPPRGTFNNHQ